MKLIGRAGASVVTILGGLLLCAIAVPAAAQEVTVQLPAGARPRKVQLLMSGQTPRTHLSNGALSLTVPSISAAAVGADQSRAPFHHFSPAAGKTGQMSTGMSLSVASTARISAVSLPYFSSSALARL